MQNDSKKSRCITKAGQRRQIDYNKNVRYNVEGTEIFILDCAIVRSPGTIFNLSPELSIVHESG